MFISHSLRSGVLWMNQRESAVEDESGGRVRSSVFFGG